MLIPKRKQPGFFLSPAFSSSHSLNGYFSETSENLSATGKCFPKLRKVPIRRKSVSRNFGKPQRDGKVLPETSESPNAAEKCFPKLRKIPARRKSASRNFGNPQCDGKVLPETSETPNAAEKCFPKLRETPARQEKLLSVLRTAYLQTFIRKIHFYQAGVCIRRVCHQCLPNPTGSVRIFCYDI